MLGNRALRCVGVGMLTSAEGTLWNVPDVVPATRVTPRCSMGASPRLPGCADDGSLDTSSGDGQLPHTGGEH